MLAPASRLVALANDTLQLECVAPLAWPTPLVSWRKNGKSMQLTQNSKQQRVSVERIAKQVTTETTAGAGSTLGGAAFGSRLTIRQANKVDDEGIYECDASVSGTFKTSSVRSSQSKVSILGKLLLLSQVEHTRLVNFSLTR